MNVNIFHSIILIYLIHYWLVNVCQEKKPRTNRKYFYDNITPLPVFIVTNVWYYLGEFGIVCYLVGFVRNIVAWKQSHVKVSLHPHKTYHHYIIINTKETNASVMEVMWFLFENIIRLRLYYRTKYIVYLLLVCNNFVHRCYFRNVI